MNFTGCLNDEAFGPAVRGCRGDFDFTIKFEQIFMVLVPVSIFTAVSLSRIVFLARRPSIVAGTVLKYTKLAAVLVYAVLQLSLLVLSATRARRFEAFLVSSNALTLVSSLSIAALSFLEHSRSPRPSILLNGYLFLTILFDVAQTRTLWLASRNQDEFTYCRLFTTGVIVKAVLLLTESAHKAKWIQWDAKQHSPEESTGVFGLGAFVWLNRLFLRGYKKILVLDDLCPLDSNMVSEALNALTEGRLMPSNFKGQKYALIRSTAKALAVPFLLPVGPRIAQSAFQLCQPFLINTLLNYLQQKPDSATHNTGIGLIGAAVLIYTGIAVSEAFYWYYQERAMYMLRGVLVNLIYRKTTEAKASAADDSAALTLMSTDTERILRGLLNMHEFWANVIEVALACWLLSRQVGVASIASLVVVAFCIVCSIFLGRITGPRQKAWMEKIQKRVGLTSSIIGQMKHLRISGLSSAVEDSVQEMRTEELAVGGRFRLIGVLSAVIGYTPLCISPVLTFAFASRTLDITTIFTSISFILLLANPLSTLFQMVPGLIASVTCFGRIQAFLETGPRVDFRLSSDSGDALSRQQARGANSDSSGGSVALKVSNGSFGYDTDKTILKKVSLEIPASRLTIVIGPVASGKSTLCKALLGELSILEGQVSVASYIGKIGYCDQTPYLTNATVRDNIIGTRSFDQTRYSQVIEAAVLLPDLVLLPQGDLTRIGSNGISLSGGQKQRVSIARALYLESALLIFDDTLSGLDADTEEQVFRRVFSPEGILRQRGATVVLCTHSVRHLPAADHIVALGADGSIVEQGTFQELMANEKYVSTLGVTESSATNGKNAKIVGDGDKPIPSLISKQSATQQVQTQEKSRMLGDTAVYKHYFARMNLPIKMAFFVFGSGWGFFYNFTTVWLKFWSEDVSSPQPKHSNAMYLGLYALFQVMTLLSLFCMSFICFRVMIAITGSKLHKEALRTVLTAPLAFFTTTDTGVVTNLFSQDMTLIDGELPMALVNISFETFAAIGLAAVIATSSPFLAITYPFLVMALFVIQRFYLRTSRQVRLLDLEAKSPLYSHFIDTIKGLGTFRAFGWVTHGVRLNSDLLDTSQRPAYLLAMIQRWLGFILQLVVAVLAILVVTLATQTRSNTAFTGASLVSLMTFGEVLAWMVKMYTALETSIGAVSRLKTFSDTVKPEDQEGEDVVPPVEWPQRGFIEIKGASAAYRNDLLSDADSDTSEPKQDVADLAINDVNLTVNPGEKIAICGRSGSGKSSMVLLLLRLLDPLPSCSDSISMDGISLRKIDRATLRQRIIAVPQEPVFLPDGTSFLANLDPYNVSTNDECQSVLERTGLWDFVSGRGGLHAGMSAETFSQGQKQLFNLARAVLRRRVRTRLAQAAIGEKYAQNSGILLLDEISSSVDQDTERSMHNIVKEEFEGYTVVMISHRLDVVMDFDRVVVMDTGRVVEDGRPADLLDIEGPRFKELWLSSGRKHNRV